MRIPLKYGKDLREFDIPDKKVAQILEQQLLAPAKNPEEAVSNALNNPIGSAKLQNIIKHKNPQNVVIVVNDITRPTPYNYMLPPLIEILNNAGIPDNNITLVVATGIHRPNSPAENDLTFTTAITSRIKVLNHNPDKNLTNIGKLSDGQELWINSDVANADLLITTGLINLHYFAGFSGGRKSILPGVVSRELITYNHSRMNEPGSQSGSITNNPVHKTMIEAARMAGVDFIINVVTNHEKKIVKVVAGDVLDAWLKGVETCRTMSTITIAQKADVVIASAGGYPKDINIYQAQKALEHAAQATRRGGTIVLVAACYEGYGEDAFQRWMEESSSWQDIFDRFEREFELGGHKAFALARALHDKQVIILTDDLPDSIIKRMHMIKANSPKQVITMLNEIHGPDWQAYIMPNAAGVLPMLAVDK